MTPEYFSTLLKDCITLLTPRLVTSEIDSASSSPHLSLLLVLSDTFSFLSTLPSQSKKDKQINQSAAFKIRFYIGQILSPSPLVFPPDGVRFVISELEMELQKRSSVSESQVDTVGVELDSTQTRSVKKGLIEEIGC